MNVASWCNRVIRFGFYLLFILVPLILTPWNYELFEYNKMMLTYGLTVIVVGAWIVKMIQNREFRVARTPLDLPIALFVGSQLVSTLFSIDPHVSWYGYYSRFNGGMFSVLSYTALYYAFITNFAEIEGVGKKIISGAASFRLTRLVKVALTTAAVIAVYGVLERLGIDKNLWVQDVQSRVFSTLGQPNWLAAYLVALVPAAMALGITENKKLSSLFYLLFSVLFFVVTLFTRSRSGYLGLAVADILFWGLLFISTKAKQSLRLPFLIVHAAFLIIIIFNGTYIDQVDRWVTLQGWRDRIAHKQIVAAKPLVTPSGTAMESGGTESGVIRKYVWEGAVTAWRGSTKNMFIGTGTETFAFAFYQYRPAGHNLTSEWDFLYNKAHNEYLNYLATTGIIGLGTYILLIGAFIFWFLKHSKNSDALPFAIFAGWVSILVTNFFGFSVVVVQLFLFLFPAIIIAFYHVRRDHQEYTVIPLKWSADIARYTSLGIVVAGSALMTGLYLFWKADTLYASGNRQGRSSQFPQAKTLDEQAIALNRAEPVYHDDLSGVLASLSLSAAQQKDATLAATLARQSIAESDLAIATSPNNVNFWKTRTKIYYTFSAFDPNLNKVAITALEKAATLSPNDPKIYYNLAILYGRDGNNDKALTLLLKAKELKHNYRDAYFGLYVFYNELKKPDDAKKELQEYLNTVDPNDKDFQDRINGTK